ncbi:hypothetical protein [Cellulomonas rhizosphaerae]|uniref:Uncharacterized protein n=1 Tax=Cellulomonas rhizosphaerae TaxID=2293719 RepID=A0A413RKW3_9CELL|nr:hypothetical protein [Cellulomonas rhizosphaerae]RHA40110.1 hypothetical protein D1825_10685 [Cellulomonas rhizosphaerae]
MADTDKHAAQSKRAVRAFDIRTIIGTLLGIYGVILLLMGIFASDSDLEGSDGSSINLLTGITLLVVSAFFLTWVRLRPLLVAEGEEDASDAHIE